MFSQSVIICTYNPTPSVLKSCLDHLEAAMEEETPLEVIIVDNNSLPAIQSLEFVQDFVKKYGNIRVIKEEKQGLTPARIRGIKESKGDILVFVDDDNYIRRDFLSKVKLIAETYSFVGCFSGQVRIISDKKPEAWTKRYWGMLVHREFKGNYWSNLYFNNDTMPCGAGLCVRRNVAQHYVKLHEEGLRSLQLDRSKGSLLSGGDNDLAMCAIDVKLGMGIFEDLYVEHFIPESRFTLDYLSKLAYGIYYSYVVLKHMRTGTIETQSFTKKILNRIRSYSMNKYDKQIQNSLNKGLNDAATYLSTKTN